MFHKHEIQEIISQSKAEHWPFPKTFDALKKAGVKYYETKVANHQIIYHGKNDKLIEPAPSGFKRLNVAKEFDGTALKNVIQKHQKEKTPYEDFLNGIASAGVHQYRVDMDKRTVSYLGAKPGEEYVEMVPAQ